MKYRVCLFVYILLVNLASANAQDGQQRMTALRSALETYVSSPITFRNHSALNHYSDLLKDHETTIRQWVFELYKTHLGTGHARTEYNRGRSSSGGIVQKDLKFVHYEMPYWFKDFGQKPDKGWPLVIVLHGGGSDKSSNDDQYEAMKTRYQPGIAARNLRYAALRAPTDEYDGFYTGYFYALLEKFIWQQIAFADIDPNRIYLIGYSHGGYGAFSAGPTMFDRFAAVHASAAAPVLGQTAIINFRDLHFSFMVGSKDSGKDNFYRAKKCQDFYAKIRSLRGDRNDIYPVRFDYKIGVEHGSLPDQTEILGLYRHVRNPTPRNIHWKLTGKSVKRMFWLQVPKPSPGQLIHGRIDGNSVHLNESGVDNIIVRLDSRLINTKEIAVSVTINGGDGVSYEIQTYRKITNLVSTLEHSGDPNFMYDISIYLDSPTEDQGLRTELKRSVDENPTQVPVVIGYEDINIPQHKFFMGPLESGPNPGDELRHTWQEFDYTRSEDTPTIRFEQSPAMTETDWIGIKDGDRVALQMPNLYHSGWIRLFVKGQWQRQWKARAIIDWLSIASSDIKAEIDSKPWPLDVSHRALAGDQPESRISFEIVNNSRRGLYVNVGPVNLRTGLV